MGTKKRAYQKAIILVLMMLCMISVYAIRESIFTDDGHIIVYPDNPDMAADYKMNYAIMNPEEFAKSKILIYDYDIQFVERALKTAQENCAQKDTHCDRVKGYQDALGVMTNIQAQQTGKPAVSIPSPPHEDSGKKKSGAWAQVSKWAKWLKDRTNLIIIALKDFI